MGITHTHTQTQWGTVLESSYSPEVKRFVKLCGLVIWKRKTLRGREIKRNSIKAYWPLSLFSLSLNLSISFSESLSPSRLLPDKKPVVVWVLIAQIDPFQIQFHSWSWPAANYSQCVCTYVCTCTLCVCLCVSVCVWIDFVYTRGAWPEIAEVLVARRQKVPSWNCD